MTFTKLVIAGSTGYVANDAIAALLRSAKPKFDITILTRADSTKPPPSIPGAKVTPVNYDDQKALVRAVTGADAILSFLAGIAAKEIDLKLLAAAQEAGVRRIFPSEYTLDILHPDAVSLLTDEAHWPEPASSVVTARKFLALAEEGGPTSFTTLVPGAFIDYWVQGDFGLFDPKNRKVTLIDDGEHYFTGCSMPFLGEALVAVLQMDEAKTKNKRIHVSEVRATMKQVAETYEEVAGTSFERANVTSRDLISQRNELLKAANPFGALFTAIQIGAFNGRGAGDLKDGMEFNGDEFLGVKRKSLRDFVVEALDKVGTA